MCMRKLMALFSIFAVSLMGADLNGTWAGIIESPDGKFEHSYVFKVEGETLTGEMVSKELGAFKIANGKVDGDSVSFTVDMIYYGDPIKLLVKGTADKNNLSLQLETADGEFSTRYVVSKQ